jgi:hypothetical protein
MNTTSIQIIRDLPTYSDDELQTLFGRLTLNMYGDDVSNEVADAVVNEKKHRRDLKQMMERLDEGLELLSQAKDMITKLTAKGV